MEENIKNTDDISIEKLVSQISCEPDKYKHLRIFLHRDRKINYKSETEYLMVTPSCFGKVKILNLHVVDGSIIIEFVDCQTQGVGFVRVDINEEKPNTLFINWNDVKNIISSDISTFFDNSELLEFDY